MGRAIAATLATAGHPTVVWNRTPGRGPELDALGVQRTDSPHAAVERSDVTILCVVDYDACDAILTAARPALAGRTIVNLTADTPARARTMADWCRSHGASYIDGAIMTPAPTIGTADASVLYSGDAESWHDHDDVWTTIGGPEWLAGDDGTAAVFDLSLLDMFWTSLAAFLHATALARAEGVTAGRLLPYARSMNELVGIVIEEFAARVDDDHHEGDISSLSSAAAALSHIASAANDHGIDTSTVDGVLTAARRMIDAGHGDAGFSILIDGLTGAR